MGFAVSGIMVAVGLATLFIFTGPSFGLRKGFISFFMIFFLVWSDHWRVCQASATLSFGEKISPDILFAFAQDLVEAPKYVLILFVQDVKALSDDVNVLKTAVAEVKICKKGEV